MEGDAIGGVMNLVMKSAPDRFVISANVSGGFSNLFSSSRPFTAFSASPNKTSPAAINGNSYDATYSDFNNKAITSDKNLSGPFSSTAGITIGDRFLNNRLGVIVSASYQNIYAGLIPKNLHQMHSLLPFRYLIHHNFLMLMTALILPRQNGWVYTTRLIIS